MAKIKVEFEPRAEIADLLVESIETAQEMQSTSRDFAIFSKALVELFVDELNIEVTKGAKNDEPRQEEESHA